MAEEKKPKFDDINIDDISFDSIDNSDKAYDSDDFSNADLSGIDFDDDTNDSNDTSAVDELSSDGIEISDDEPDNSELDDDTEDESGTNEVDTDSIEDSEVSTGDSENDTDDESGASYSDGTDVDSNELLADDDSDGSDDENKNDFIDESGDIIVQDKDDSKENGFDLIYLDIDKIGIANRIRETKSVEGLMRSIESTGLLNPIVVAPTITNGVYILLDGYRRVLACAGIGKKRIPCVVNNKVSTPELPMIEAMYNQNTKYTIKEEINYIDYLEKQKGIMNPNMIEFLLQMNSGDYLKLKDILADNDDDIVSKLYDGTYDIATAFKKLEQRRKKESAEEKENKKAAKVYDNEAESGADQIADSGETGSGQGMTDDEIKELTQNAHDLDSVEDQDLGQMIEDDKQIEGFDPHHQKVGEREYIDPKIKKAVMARDNSTCQCCKRGGEEYADTLDLHHMIPVYCGGEDSVDNSIMLCLTCHHMVHLYAQGDLSINKELIDGNWDELSEDRKKKYQNSEDIFRDEQNRFKRIVKLGGLIRKAMAAKGITRDKMKKEHPVQNIGRRKIGSTQEAKNE